MNRAAFVCAVVAVVLAVNRPAAPSTVIDPSFDDLATHATEIFIGTTVGRTSRLIDGRDGRAIVTVVTFRVEENLKGARQTETSLEFLGGSVGDVGMAVA